MKKGRGWGLAAGGLCVALIFLIASASTRAATFKDGERKRQNESTAISVLKQYTTAQVTFQVGKQGRDGLNTKTGATGYADNFRNLFYGKQFGQSSHNLALISQEIADAFAGPTSGAATRNSFGESPSSTTTPPFARPAPGTATSKSSGKPPASAGTPYQGYLFLEPLDLGTDFYHEGFALIAYPAEAYKTGDSIYLIDPESTIYMLYLGDLGEDAPHLASFPNCYLCKT